MESNNKHLVIFLFFLLLLFSFLHNKIALAGETVSCDPAIDPGCSKGNGGGGGSSPSTTTTTDLGHGSGAQQCVYNNHIYDAGECFYSPFQFDTSCIPEDQKKPQDKGKPLCCDLDVNGQPKILLNPNCCPPGTSFNAHSQLCESGCDYQMIHYQNGDTCVGGSSFSCINNQLVSDNNCCDHGLYADGSGGCVPPVEQTCDFSHKHVKQIIITFKPKNPAAVGTSHAILRNIHLIPKNPSEQRYCSAGRDNPFSMEEFSWTKDLDDPQEGIIGCNNLLMGGWTGSQCCGDDLDDKDFYVDTQATQAACYKGYKIDNDTSFGEIFGVLNATLFEVSSGVGKYHLCQKKVVSYHKNPMVEVGGAFYPLCPDALNRNSNYYCTTILNNQGGTDADSNANAPCVFYNGSDWEINTEQSGVNVYCWNLTSSDNFFTVNPHYSLLQSLPSDQLSFEDQCSFVGNFVCDSDLGWLRFYKNTSVSYPVYPFYDYVFRNYLDDFDFSSDDFNFSLRSLPDAFDDAIRHFNDEYLHDVFIKKSACCPVDTCWDGTQCVSPGTVINSWLQTSENVNDACLNNLKENGFTHICQNGEWKNISELMNYNPDFSCANLCPSHTCFLNRNYPSLSLSTNDYDFDGIPDDNDQCYQSETILLGQDGYYLNTDPTSDTYGCIYKDAPYPAGTLHDKLISLYRVDLDNDKNTLDDQYFCVPENYSPYVQSGGNSYQMNVICLQGNWTTKTAYLASMMKQFINEHFSALGTKDYEIYCDSANDDHHVFFPRTLPSVPAQDFVGCVLSFKNQTERLFGFVYDDLTHLQSSLSIGLHENEWQELNQEYFNNNLCSAGEQCKDGFPLSWYDYKFHVIGDTQPSFRANSAIHLWVNPALHLAFVWRFSHSPLSFDQLFSLPQGTNFLSYLLNPLESLVNLLHGATNQFIEGENPELIDISHLIPSRLMDKFLEAVYAGNDENKTILAYHVRILGEKQGYLSVRYENFSTNFFFPIQKYLVTPSLYGANAEAAEIRNKNNDLIGYHFLFKFANQNAEDEIMPYWNFLTSQLRIANKLPLHNHPYFNFVAEGSFVKQYPLKLSAYFIDENGNMRDLSEKTCTWYVDDYAVNSSCLNKEIIPSQDVHTIKVTFTDGEKTYSAEKTFTFIDEQDIIQQEDIHVQGNGDLYAKITFFDEAKVNKTQTLISWYKGSERVKQSSLDKSDALFLHSPLDPGYSYFYNITPVVYGGASFTKSFVSPPYTPPLYELACQSLFDADGQAVCPSGYLTVLGYNNTEGYDPGRAAKNKRCCQVLAQSGNNALYLTKTQPPNDKCKTPQFYLLDTNNEWVGACLWLTGTPDYNVSCRVSHDGHCSSDEECITSVDAKNHSLGPCGLTGYFPLCCGIEEVVS